MELKSEIKQNTSSRSIIIWGLSNSQIDELTHLADELGFNGNVSKLMWVIAKNGKIVSGNLTAAV